jgi:hypothetical protein
MRTNSDLCHLQHKLIGFYNRDEKCLLRGTNWVFKWSSLRFVFEGLICRLWWLGDQQTTGDWQSASASGHHQKNKVNALRGYHDAVPTLKFFTHILNVIFRSVWNYIHYTSDFYGKDSFLWIRVPMYKSICTGRYIIN